MAKAGFTGPLMSLGNVSGGQAGSAPREYSDEVGPSILWAGTMIPATGQYTSKDRVGPGAIPGVYIACPQRTVNAALTAGAAALTVAGFPTSGVPLVNLSTYNVGRAIGTPVTIGGVPLLGIALDMGLDTAVFTTGATNNLTLSVIGNAWRYRVGQWVGLLNGGAGGVTLMSQITAIVSATGVMTMVPAPAAAVTGQIALSNRYNQNLYGASGPPSSLSSEAPAGTARISIPEVANTRGVGITCVVGGAIGNVLIQGIDGYGALTSELITTVATATTVWGKKTYDIFLSATPQFTDASHNLTVVTSDFIGFPLSVMSADSLVAVTFGGAAQVAGTGYTLIPADTTNPATQLTGDPRGGIQVTGNGPAAAPGTPLTLNGTTVLQIDQRLNPLQVARADVINVGPLLGVAPV